MDSTTIDGRFLVLLIAVILLMFAIIIQTLNIWLENQDHRRARAWDKGRCNKNFIDWFANKAAANQFFLNTIILFSIPMVAIWMWIRYPNLCWKKVKDHFYKQINSALEYLIKR